MTDFTGNIQTAGPEYSFCEGNIFIGHRHSDDLPNGITYLTVGQPIEGQYITYDGGNKRAIGFELVGPHIRTGKIVHKTDEFGIIKDLDGSFYRFELDSTIENFELNTWGTYTIEELEENTEITDSDLLAMLSVVHYELTIDHPQLFYCLYLYPFFLLYCLFLIFLNKQQSLRDYL